MELTIALIIVLVLGFTLWVLLCSNRAYDVQISYVNRIHDRSVEHIENGEYVNITGVYDKMPKYSSTVWKMVFFMEWESDYFEIEKYINA
jgi:hypothetical protein